MGLYHYCDERTDEHMASLEALSSAEALILARRYGDAGTVLVFDSAWNEVVA
jgi:hypothetical protein